MIEDSGTQEFMHHSENQWLQGVFTLPSTSSFLPGLADGIIARVAATDGVLTDWRILLPTRRAARELRDAFLKKVDSGPILLPRLQSIGDVDADELDFHLAGFGDMAHDIPDAIPSLDRLFLLAKLIRQKDQHLSIDQSLSLARGLARLIDQTHTEDLDFSRLTDIVPVDLSDHWKKTLDFLEIVTQFWPAILAERCLVDPADRRNRLMKALISFWQNHPPKTPVLAAGSTGSIPTTARLLSTIKSLPQGMVVLPALDIEMDEDRWADITSTHPQATMKNLLHVMQVDRTAVRMWTKVPETHQTYHRRAAVRAMMAPSTFFGKDRDIDIASGLTDITFIEARNPQEEAATIAVAIRSILEDSHKTACFVTPDRILARRVMTALSRWGIEVDDSAGGALAVTPSATFFGAILRCVQDSFSPLTLLTLLKHPLCVLSAHESLADFEKEILRGARPAPGISGLYRRIELLEEHSDKESLLSLLSNLHDSISSLNNVAAAEHNADYFVNSLVTSAEKLAGGDNKLWSQNESETFAKFLIQIQESARYLPPLTLNLFIDVFQELLNPETYRETDPRHRRILFLGQLESRLVRRDVMILGGLNESTWPADQGFDPWMSRPMRRDFGLPTSERSIGLSAHDFSSHLGASEVIVTRAIKEGGTATVPARWLQRLKALMDAAKIPYNWTESVYLDWARVIDLPKGRFEPISSPAPCPPREVRPQKLSVTAIEKWMNNPYRIYAERILKLRPLSPIDEDVTRAERGSFVHDIVGQFIKDYPGELPQNARSILLERGRDKFGQLETVAPHWHYWWPRFERIIDWFLLNEKDWRQTAIPWKQEEEGRLLIYKSSNTQRIFEVTAKADRIDRLKTGGAFIIDYKTGTPPTWTRVAKGLAPQLPLEALIARGGGWGEPQIIAGFSYWQMGGSFSSPGEVKVPKRLDIEATINAAAEGLQQLVIKFEDPQTPYMACPPSGRIYDDERAFSHLARTAEWASEGSDNSEDDDEGVI